MWTGSAQMLVVAFLSWLQGQATLKLRIPSLKAKSLMFLLHDSTDSSRFRLYPSSSRFDMWSAWPQHLALRYRGSGLMMIFCKLKY